MTAMFPQSGVPWSDAFNSLQDPATVNCDELWYSTSRCAPRFDPAAANAVLSELINLINKGEVTYDCHFLDQVQTAVRYLIQRGMPRGVYMTGGPNTYTGTMDPPITRHNNFMTLTIVPALTNLGPVTLNLGLGNVPILRNDGQPLQRQDLRQGIPALIAYINGIWYHCGLVASQVPLLVPGGIDAWVRPGGNDITGDGTENTDAKAFATIQGAWNAVSTRYATTPRFTINIKLGVPGVTYPGAVIGPYGGFLTITGDQSAPASYRIGNINPHPGAWVSLWCEAMNSIALTGVTMLIDHGPPDFCTALRLLRSHGILRNCRFETLQANAPGGRFIEVRQGSFGTMAGTLTFEGNNLQIVEIFSLFSLASAIGAYLLPGEQSIYNFSNIPISSPNGSGLSCVGLSTMHWGSATSWNQVNCTGNRYWANQNSIIDMGGKVPPGTGGTGAVANGSFFFPT